MRKIATPELKRATAAMKSAEKGYHQFKWHQPPPVGYSHGVRAQYHSDAFFTST
jgi:hypothetical protein